MVDARAGRLPVPARTLLLAVLLATACVLSAAVVRTSAASTPYAFAPSGLDGAGFQNVVAFSPFLDGSGARPLLLGADIAGIHRSLDGGKNWLPSNAGLRDEHVASLLFSDAVPGKVYAATDSALYVSTDFGISWTARAGAVHFDANGVYKLNSQEHPRPTGNLLAQDTAGPVDYLYAATATQGVKRSRDDGATWEKVALVGDHLRAIALDPAHPDTLYVGDATKGLQVSTDARSGFTFTRAAGGPGTPEELTFVGGTLYVAGGTAGLFRFGGGWTQLGNGVPTGPAWESITGYVDPNTQQTVLFAGCARPVGGKHTLRSTDGGATWEPISTGAGVTVDSHEYGQDVQWWAAGKNYLGFTNSSFVDSMIAVDPDDQQRIVMAGRGGAWVAEQSPSGVAWAPAVRGLMAVVGMVVAADPKVPGRVYAGTMDWTVTASADAGRSFIGDAVPVGAGTTGDFLALDPTGPAGTPSTVYLAASAGGSAGGAKIYSNPDPIATPQNWADEKLPVTTDVQSLGVGHDSSGTRILLAAVSGKGLYRKAGGTWSLVGGTAPFPTGNNGSIAWVAGSPLVYAMDDHGVWRSAAAGAPGTWTKLLTASAGYGNISSLAVDPAQPGVLYASDGNLGGIVRLTGADTATPVRTTILPLANPGPIAVTPDGALLAQDRGSFRLLRATTPTATSPAFDDVGGAFFAANDQTIRSLSVGADGFVYTASNHAGVTVAPPADGSSTPVDDVPPSVPGTVSPTGVTSSSVSLTWGAATDDVGVAYYQVLRNGAVVGATSGATSYTDSGLHASTGYAYSVRALDAAGNRGPTTDPLTVTTTGPPPDTTPPTPPTGVVARVVSPTQVRLSWQPGSDDVGVTGYRVRRDGTSLGIVSGLSYSDSTVTAGPHSYSVTARDAAGNESTAATGSVNVPAAAAKGLTGAYFDTASFTSLKASRVDSTVNFDWGTGRPMTTVGADTFSVQWTGKLLPVADGTYTFYLSSDEGARMSIDGSKVLDDWTAHLVHERTVVLTLKANQAHPIGIDYYDKTGAASVRLSWSGPGFGKQVVPAAQLLAQ